MINERGEGFEDKVLTYASCPGYRSINLIVEINDGHERRKVELCFSAADALSILRDIADVNRTAWMGGRPIDAKDGERPPAWLACF